LSVTSIPFAGQTVGVTQVGERILLVTFMSYGNRGDEGNRAYRRGREAEHERSAECGRRLAEPAVTSTKNAAAAQARLSCGL
jgi:hypothetical protein